MEFHQFGRKELKAGQGESLDPIHPRLGVKAYPFKRKGTLSDACPLLEAVALTPKGGWEGRKQIQGERIDLLSQ